MGGWPIFFRRICRFPLRLYQNGPLFFYFIIVICILGALGAWIPAAQIWFGESTLTWLDVQKSLATYVIGIAVTAFADCVVRRQDEDDKTFVLFLLGLTVFGVASAIVVLLLNKEPIVSRFSFWGTLVAAVLWLEVNDSHRELTTQDAYSTIGGQLP